MAAHPRASQPEEPGATARIEEAEIDGEEDEEEASVEEAWFSPQRRKKERKIDLRGLIKEEAEASESVAYENSDLEEELSSETKQGCATALKDIILYNCAPDMEEMEEDVIEDLLGTRPCTHWIDIIEAACKEVAAESEHGAEEWQNLERLCFNGNFGSGAGLGLKMRARLKLMMGLVTLWEALQVLGPDWSPIAQAIQKLAQIRLFDLASGCIFGGIHTPSGRCGLTGLLRAGACLLRTDARGRVPVHLAAEGSDLLPQLLSGAPLALLVEDSEGRTPLDALSGSLSRVKQDRDVLDALTGAALHCLAAMPQQTVRVLRRSPSASTTWDALARREGGSGLLLASWEEHPDEKLAELLTDAEEAETGAAERLQSGTQRVLLLRSLAADHAEEIEGLEREELQLRLKRCEDALRQRDEAEKQMKESLEKEVKRLQTQLVECEDELTSLRSFVASHQFMEKEVDPVGGNSLAPKEDFPRITDTSPTSKPKGRAAKKQVGAASAKAASRKSLGSMQTEVEVLEEIRNARMVGTDPALVPLELRNCIAGMRESLTAAVDRLAHDLYESEAHFLQELLQNADDNKYDPHVVPSLRLVLRRSNRVDAPMEGHSLSSTATRSYFYAANNEIGLTEADVRSICDISRSSKSQSDSSTTGHKGVGWKAVFRVCDTPHVLSKGWRFRFSATGLGMLTPEVIDDSEYAKLPAEVREAHSSGLTVFYLPLTSDKVAHSIELELEVIEAETAQLLFLRRIREISLCGFRQHSSRLSVVDDGGIRTTTRCTRTPLEASVGGEEEQIETHFEVCSHDDVTVALPLVEEPTAQRIFAFLPVRSVGFRFAVHSPFHLTASRTDLHRSTDNLWRRNAVAPAFLKACEASEEVASKALRFLGTVPAEPFWLSAHAAILAGLQGIACVMSENGMVDPRSCLLRGDEQIAQWVPEQLLAEACGLTFAAASNPLAAMRELGVATFGFDHLVACLQHNDGAWIKDMWRDSKSCTFFSDMYASLHDALVANVDRFEIVQNLRIFPLHNRAASKNQVMISDSVGLFSGFTDAVPETWQAPLVRCIGDLELLAHGRKLLQVLGVNRVDEMTLEKLALRQLIGLGSRSSAARSAQESHTAWAALAVLQRCHRLGRTPPKPWKELRDAIALPSANGEMLVPRLLQPWSFMGVEERLPRNVLQTVHEYAGIQLRSLSDQRIPRERVAPPRWDRPRGLAIRWHLEWEIFLCELGCAPVDPTGSSGDCSLESTLKLGDILTRGDFWQSVAQSPAALKYIQSALGRGQTRRQWLRRLPVTLEDGSIAAIEDFYLHEAFHSLGGAHLPYVVGAPEVTHEFLGRLGVSTRPDQLALMKCLRWLRAHEASDVGLMADLYARVGALGISLEEEPLPLLFVPGRGWVRPTDCCWSGYGNDILQRCSRFSSLAEHYGRFGETICRAMQAWVISCPESNVHDLVQALLNAINVAKGNLQAYTGFLPTLAQEVVSSKLLEASHYAITAIANICKDEDKLFEAAYIERRSRTWTAPSDIAASSFSNNRLIVVPDSSFPRVLWLKEAFWSVAPELQQQACASFALELHYGGNETLRNFFINILGVREVLTVEDMMQMYRQGGNTSSSPGGGGRVIEGLSLFAFPSPSSASSSASCGPSPSTQMNNGGVPVGAAMAKAQQAQHAKAGIHRGILPPRGGPSVSALRALPRMWKHVTDMNGFAVFVIHGSTIPPGMVPPDTLMLSRILALFSMHPAQVGLAYDPSGRCVCEDRLFLDYQHGTRLARLMGNYFSWQNAATFWTSELAHAIAHLSLGPGHGPALSLLQSEITATYLPMVMNSEFAAQAAYMRT